MHSGMIELSDSRLGRADDGRHEVRCAVAGEEVVVRSATELAPAADGPVCAFFLPALAAQRAISSVTPIDRTLRSNLEQAAEIAGRFWGYAGPMPEAPLTDRTPAGITGQFFTGGVDSFYTLRQNLDRVRCLVNVHGFDIELGDTDRFARSNALLQRVAEGLSIELVSVATNLRRHPLFRSINWEVTHVAALASVAHALAPVLGRVHVAGSDVAPPWGSHPSLDRLWSSSAVTIVNDEEGVRRLDKVEAIADWQPVHGSLRVCWENRTAELNCGVCEKCVRTQAQFAAVGRLGDLLTFPSGDLVQRINGILCIHKELGRQWRDIRDAVDDRRLRSAIDRLLRRSLLLSPARNAFRSAGLTRDHIRRLTGGLVG